MPTPSPDYLISQIMPAREVHLLAGPSGVGKSNLLSYILPTWLEEGELWGFRCHPPARGQGAIVVSCDRSEESIQRNLDRHGLTKPWPFVAARMIPGDDRLKSVMDWVRSHHPEVRLLVVEGIARLVPEGKISDYAIVAEFLERAQFYCKSYNLTLLGTAHATKTKDTEKFPNPRQRILGSVAWGAYSDLVIVMDPEDPEDVRNKNRVIHVLPRDAEEFVVKMCNSGGVLKSVDEEAEDQMDSLMDQELGKIPAGAVVSTLEFVRIAFNLSLSRPTCERWISRTVMQGRLQRVGRGKYAKVSIA